MRDTLRKQNCAIDLLEDSTRFRRGAKYFSDLFRRRIATRPAKIDTPRRRSRVLRITHFMMNLATRRSALHSRDSVVMRSPAGVFKRCHMSSSCVSITSGITWRWIKYHMWFSADLCEMLQRNVTNPSPLYEYYEFLDIIDNSVNNPRNIGNKRGDILS